MNLFKFATAFAAISFFCPFVLQSQDWPAFRGADGNGSASPGGVLSKSSDFNLKVRWKKNLGSGYSSVVVADGFVVTMYTDGKNDKVICLDKETGETVWQTVSGPSFKGENGSFDGPIATPLIFDGHVYALDPSGKFACLKLEDGSEVWSKHLVDDEGSTKPMYGFATSPIVVGGTVILQTGVEEKSLAGFDPKTGEVRWAVSNDRINSQTPATMNFHGTEIVLAAGGKKLTGVDPKNGNILLEYEHGGGNGAAMVPVPIDDYRVVLTLDDSFSKAVSLRPGDTGKILASDEWQTNSIKNTYNVPALTDGNLYAYSTRILTCVDAKTGKAKWKSRAPGDGFLIAIDGHVIISTKEGSLHVAKADDSGFKSVADLELFNDLCWSIPAYSDNAIFVRNLKEIACVDIETSSPIDTTTPASGPKITKAAKSVVNLQAKLANTGSADEKKQLIDEFMKAQETFPVVDAGVVTFVYRGNASDVAVASDIFGTRQERKMMRIEDTGLFHYSIALEPDQRANYMFLVDYKPQTDPMNSRSVTSSVYAGEMEFAVRLPNEKPLEMSWFAMPEWKQPEWLKDLPKTLAGSMVKHHVDIEKIENGIDVDIYLPPDYETNEESRYRTVYIFSDPTGRTIGQIEKAVDNIFSADNSEVPPAILVFVGRIPVPNADQVIVDELIPSIDGAFRTIANRDGRTTAGFGFAGAVAIELVAKHNSMFCGGATYSPLAFDAAQAALNEGVSKISQPTELYIEWGRFDMFNPHENWDIRGISKQMFESWQGNSTVTVRGGMVNDSSDWGSWRNRFIEFLKVGPER